MALGAMLYGIGPQYSANASTLEVYLPTYGYETSDMDTSDPPWSSTVGIWFYNDGSTSLYGGSYINQSPGWLTNGTNSQVDVRITKTSGLLDVTDGMADNTWYNLANHQHMLITNTQVGERSYTGTIYLREAGASPENILASCSLILSILNGNL